MHFEAITLLQYYNYFIVLCSININTFISRQTQSNYLYCSIYFKIQCLLQCTWVTVPPADLTNPEKKYKFIATSKRNCCQYILEQTGNWEGKYVVNILKLNNFRIHKSE